MKSALPVASENSVSLLFRPNTLGVSAQGVRNFFWPRVVDIYRQVFGLLKKDPTLFMLFAMISLFDLIALLILFLAPIAPVSYILAPIIRTFWSDYYLHYPQNFLLLPKLFNHAHFLIVATFGILVNGFAVKKIENQLLTGQRLSSLLAAGPVFKKYGALLTAWLLVYFFFTTSLKISFKLLPRILWLHLGVMFSVTLLGQAVAFFLLPSILLSGKGFWGSLGEGLNKGLQNLALTSVVVAFPISTVVLLSFFRIFIPVYIQFCPELTLWILIIGSVAMAGVDLFLSAAATVLYLEPRSPS